MSENTLKNTIIAGIFIIPFTSLIVMGNFFFPYITPKNLAFRLITLIITATFVFLMYKSKRFRPNFGTIGWSLLVFIVILFFADIFGQYSHKSFFSNFERMEGFFTLLILFFYFTVLNGVMKTEKIWENLLNTFLISSVIMAMYALVEKSHGVPRLAAQLGNSTYLGIFTLFNIFFAVFLIIRRLDRKNDTNSGKFMVIGIYVLVALLNLYIFYYTGTRGALLGLFAGMMFIAVLFAFFEKHNRKLKYAGFLILLLVVLSVGGLFAFRDSSYVKNSQLLSRFSALISAPTDLTQYFETEGKGRVGIWKLAIKGVGERPLLGWGQESFNYVFNKHYTPDLYGQEQWFDRAHNVFLDWLVTGGILGLISYLSMFFFGVFSLWRKKRQDETHHFTFADKTILTALLGAYFIHNIFVFDSITSYILFFTVLAYISIHEKAIPFTKKINLSFLKKEVLAALGTAAFALATIVGIYYLVISPYITSTHIINALSFQNAAMNNTTQLTLPQRNALIAQSLGDLKKSIKFGVVGTAEAHEQLLQVGGTIVPATGVNQDVKDAFSSTIDSEMKKQLAETPEDARYFLLYGTYLSSIGQFEASLPYYKRAEELSPNKQTLIISEGLVYLNLQRYEEMLVLFKKAYDLDQSSKESRIFYAIGQIYAGDNKSADEILAPLQGTIEGTDNRIIRAYYDTKQLTKIDKLLNDKLMLANTLSAAGDKVNAVKLVQDVINIKPSFKTQGEQLIFQIQNGN